jgi:LysR family transcriptional regulator, regulator for bpeEF and oprC
MDQLRCMRSFIRVAELGSFTRAADSLKVSRTVVGTQIAELEQHLGCPLLQRTTRRVALTVDGSHYLVQSRRLLAELEAADEAMGVSPAAVHGRLRIGTPALLGRSWLIGALPEFTVKYPGLQLEVVLNDEAQPADLDLAVRLGAVRDSSLLVRRVATTRVVTCASAAYLGAHPAPAQPGELAAHKLIGYLDRGSAQAWLFQRGVQRRRLTPAFSIAFDSVDAQVVAAVHGAGIVQALDLPLAEGLASGVLQPVLPPWSGAMVPVSVVRRGSQREALKAQTLADFVSELLLERRRQLDALPAVLAQA